jgi:hypothetical protein
LSDDRRSLTIAHDVGDFVMTNREQISVPLPPELRAYVQTVAEREDQSQASVIRRLVAEAAARQAQELAA